MSMNFSSWPAQQEQTFIVYENYRFRVANPEGADQRQPDHAGAAVFLFAAGIYFGFTPESKDLTKDMNMSNISKKKAADKPAEAAPAPAPTPDK